MAYVKISQIKSEAYLKQAIAYILNPKKTEELLNTASYMCSAEYAPTEFRDVRMQAIKKGNNIAHEIYQSFSPEDNIDHRQALMIGQELMKSLYPNYQYVIATHNDRKHIHNHIIMNSVDYETFHKLHSNTASLEKLRKTSDKLCQKYGLSVIVPLTKSKRKKIKTDIDEAINTASSYAEFIKILKVKNYDIKIGEYISVKSPSSRTYIRIKSLGSAYTDQSIQQRINHGITIENKLPNVYSDKAKKMPQRLRLKKLIDANLKLAADYDEFLSLMKQDYVIKQGKHLAFLHSTGQRYIRAASLGEEYAEAMLRLKFNDPDEYSLKLKGIKALQIDKLHNPQNKFAGRYTQIRNADIQIKMLNYLHANNIQSYEELISNISRLESKLSEQKKKVKAINEQIAAKRSVIKAIRTYWQYKPLYQHYVTIDSVAEKELFMNNNRPMLQSYMASIDIMNNSNLPNGTLPKSADLKEEIQRLSETKDNYSEQMDILHNELSRYKSLKYNADCIIETTPGLSVDNRNIR